MELKYIHVFLELVLAALLIYTLLLELSSPLNIKHDPVIVPKKEVSGAVKINIPILTREIYESGFSYPNLKICHLDGLHIKLVILVLSAPNNFRSREAIRLTWGHYSQRNDIVIAFLIGKTEDINILVKMEIEKNLYDDLIIANFMDTYNNLTLKTMSALEWLKTYCYRSEFFLKSDDDMFNNIPNILKLIDSIEMEDKKRRKIYGLVKRNSKPYRSNDSKYYVPVEIYNATEYPDYTFGPAYLFNLELVRPLFQKGLERIYMKVEDVYWTGIIAQDLNTERFNIPEFVYYGKDWKIAGDCKAEKLHCITDVNYEDQFFLWKHILDGNNNCTK